jgi:hypothetical protein
MSTIDANPGDPVKLCLQMIDGQVDVYPRATIFNGNGSPVPVAAVNLDHKSLGFYRADWQPPCPGRYFAVYRVFTDAARTVEGDFDRALDTISVWEWDPPVLGVAYDDTAQALLLEASLNRNGVPVTPPTVVGADVTVYSNDDTVLFTVNDTTPDSQGMFRLAKFAPGLVADHLYSVHISVTTNCGVVVGRKGFMTTT